MDWELVVQVLGIVLGSLISVLQIVRRLPRSRTALKADLEILELMQPDDPLYAVVKRNIDGRIREIYAGDQTKPNSTVSWGGVALSSVVLASFAGWTAYILQSGFSWSAVGTAVIAVLSFFALVGSFVADVRTAGAPPSQTVESG